MCDPDNEGNDCNCCEDNGRLCDCFNAAANTNTNTNTNTNDNEAQTHDANCVSICTELCNNLYGIFYNESDSNVGEETKDQANLNSTIQNNPSAGHSAGKKLDNEYSTIVDKAPNVIKFVLVSLYTTQDVSKFKKDLGYLYYLIHSKELKNNGKHLDINQFQLSEKIDKNYRSIVDKGGDNEKIKRWQELNMRVHSHDGLNILASLLSQQQFSFKYTGPYGNKTDGQEPVGEVKAASHQEESPLKVSMIRVGGPLN